ncbi:hypothetical protein ACIO3O_37055 [Streptomyces sp. NPDC087440]|uniref:hypothetical protein n=1 Tax=Streptomyces sp. NPDC087440 TaxID=3365790 RepID=UPI0037FF493C
MNGKTETTTTPTEYQADVLIAALDNVPHLISTRTDEFTVDKLHARRWVEGRTLTALGCEVARQARAGRELSAALGNVATEAEPQALPSAEFTVGSAARYDTGPTHTERDVVLVNSKPAADGTVEVLSARQGGAPLRVPLAALQPIPALPPRPEGDPTDWWTVTDAQGKEIARVQASNGPEARITAIREDDAVRAVDRREGGLSTRRLVSSELDVPLGELQGLPRTAPVPPAEQQAAEFMLLASPPRLSIDEVIGQADIVLLDDADNCCTGVHARKSAESDAVSLVVQIDGRSHRHQSTVDRIRAAQLLDGIRRALPAAGWQVVAAFPDSLTVAPAA